MRCYLEASLNLIIVYFFLWCVFLFFLFYFIFKLYKIVLVFFDPILAKTTDGKPADIEGQLYTV